MGISGWVENALCGAFRVRWQGGKCSRMLTAFARVPTQFNGHEKSALRGLMSLPASLLLSFTLEPLRLQNSAANLKNSSTQRRSLPYQSFPSKHADEFKGFDEIKFEAVEVVSGTTRRADLVGKRKVNGLERDVHFEFKSVKDIPPGDFANQFIKDLSKDKIESLDQIKWIFDSRKLGDKLVDGKLPKDTFVDALEGSADQLGSEQIKAIFKAKYPDEIIDSGEDVLDVMRRNDEWFETIFSAK